MNYQQFENTVGEMVFKFMGEWNTNRARLCKKCFNKGMNIEETVSHIIFKS